ncbi:hypothetical protein POM88_018332 [Heracleum sosnowskyi]|uniref:Uncharacterized protein n=1 Tax=Heracleum sosnowskyi TaxID=360622 RepID=A0AAD8MYV8_9APIA|nr:hypothetical protein POM88_018332 [Heracleum sosnowskyi]
MKSVEEKERDEAHLHVLQNNSEVHPYIMMHKDTIVYLLIDLKKRSVWSVVLNSAPRDYQELYYDDELGDTTLENPSFFSNIPICDKVDDSECIIASKRQNVEGIWIKN